MGTPYSSAIVLLLVGALLLFSRARLAAGAGAPRVRARPLMTRIERETIAYIEAALPEARVHAQVSLGALLRPVPGLGGRDATSVRNRFLQKRADYVLEDRRTGRIIALVELDDRTHDARRDAARDRMTAAAGYLTIRLPAGERPSMAGVAERIRAALPPSGPPAAAPDPSPAFSPASTHRVPARRRSA